MYNAQVLVLLLLLMCLLAWRFTPKCPCLHAPDGLVLLKAQSKL